MSLTAKESDGATEFETVPEGQYIGRCYKIIDQGTQTNSKGKENHKVMISWELIGPDDPKMQDGKPFSATQWYTVSLYENSNLRKDLESWRTRKFTPQELEGFDLANVLGQYCIIQIIHDSGYANVNSIMGYKGDKPKPVNENVIFDIDNPDMEVFNKFGEKMKSKITSAPEWNKKPEPTTQVDDVVIIDIGEEEPINIDDIPF